MYVSLTWYYVHIYVRKKGIKNLEERAVAAIFKEYQQLNDGPMPGNPVLGQINNE